MAKRIGGPYRRAAKRRINWYRIWKINLTRGLKLIFQIRYQLKRGYEHAALRSRALKPQRPAVRGGDPARDREAEAGAAAGAVGGGAAGGFDAEETLEDFFAQLARHAGAAVAH